MGLSFGPQISRAVQHGLVVRVEDFIGNGLFREQKPVAGFRNQKELRARITNRLGQLIDYFDLTSGTVTSRFTEQNYSDSTQTELVGVAAGISAMNDFIGTTQADWRRIPVQSGRKSIDFDCASSGSVIASLEAKGTLNENYISARVREIGKQKASARKSAPVQPLVGVVTYVPSSSKERARCVICDPAIPPIPHDPFKYQLLARLAYYYEVISLFSMSFLLQSLAQRILDIALIEDFRALSGRELVNRAGNPMSVPTSMTVSLTNEPGLRLAGDFIYSRDRQSFIFYGISMRALSIIIAQQFEALCQYRDDLDLSVTTNRRVNALIDRQQINNWASDKTDGTPPGGSRDYPGRAALRLSGALGTTSTGLAFGEFQPL